ncbi:MAG: ParB N-terminal domain-containing protein [Deltaproteobacteria bacterium]|nr:ParB N-terminal domain-containing protein [Deltaproteobacteria bacterium]
MARIQEVPLSDIDLDDHPFAVASSADISPLSASMAEVGLLNPPWLRKKAEAGWQVVTGLKRLKSAARLRWEKIAAHTLSAETPDSRCLSIALQDNAFGRSFSPGEQVFYINRLTKHWDEAQIVQHFLPLLGLPPSAKILHRFLAAGSLEEAWQDLLVSGRLALTAAARLAAWPAAARRAAFPFFRDLPFSQSKQEELLKWLELLARRQDKALEDFLLKPELTACLEDPALNPQEKAQRVRRRLKDWTFPRLSAALRAFEQGLAGLGLAQHPRVRLSPPPAFEGPDFHLEIKFRDADELRSLLDTLTSLARQEDFSALTAI